MRVAAGQRVAGVNLGSPAVLFAGLGVVIIGGLGFFLIKLKSEMNKKVEDVQAAVRRNEAAMNSVQDVARKLDGLRAEVVSGMNERHKEIEEQSKNVVKIGKTLSKYSKANREAYNAVRRVVEKVAERVNSGEGEKVETRDLLDAPPIIGVDASIKTKERKSKKGSNTSTKGHKGKKKYQDAESESEDDESSDESDVSESSDESDDEDARATESRKKNRRPKRYVEVSDDDDESSDDDEVTSKRSKRNNKKK